MPSRHLVHSAACLVLSIGLGTLASASPTGNAVPYPTAETPKAVDLGAIGTLSANTPLTLTVALSLPDGAAAEELLAAVTTPGNSQYHHFLTSDQFVSRFAPAKSAIAKVTAGLTKYNLSVVQTTALTLTVSGLPADVERAFSVSLHGFAVPAHGQASGYTFHAPVGSATLPAELSSLVSGVAGLDSRPALHPFHKASPAQLGRKPPVASGSTLDPFGYLTVLDFAQLYDVQPLYDQGVTGKGRTIGIMSFANFTPSDAYAYWASLGLTVDPNRIQVVYVDGGPGAPSDASGSLETTLDTEQSGGIAPGAKIIVYLAPNENQPFLDIFATAIEANKADSLSMSWGGWEYWDNLAISPVTDPITGKTVSITQAVHEQLVRAAIQGQSVFTSQGDGGAYEAFHDLGCTGPYSPSQVDSCSQTLTVSYPGTDPAITSAGGTTLPGTQDYCLNSACTPPYYVVDIPQQRVWGWDYLEGFCSAIGYDIYSCGIFPGGGGGGVSITFTQPVYQWGVWGTQLSQPNQVFQAASGFADDGIPLYTKLPAFFPGRNVPDVSFNADPETGYTVFYTSSVSGYSEQSGWGGTSFVAPQLNGVTALLDQDAHGRLGLLNPTLYALQGIKGSKAPLHPIAYGDNWFYHGSNGYNLGAGLGTLDVANFAAVLNTRWW